MLSFVVKSHTLIIIPYVINYGSEPYAYLKPWLPSKGPNKFELTNPLTPNIFMSSKGYK